MNGSNATLLAKLRRFWRPVLALTQKELLQFSRDVILIFAVLYFFTGEVYLAGKAVTMDLKNAPIGIMDHDLSETSRDWISKLRPPYYDIKGSVPDQQTANKLLDHSELLGVIDIPAQFEERLRRRQPTEIAFQLDASNVILGNLAASYTAMINAQFNEQLMRQQLKITANQTLPAPLVDERQRVLFNPEGRDEWFMPLSEMLTVLTLMSLFLPAAIAVREKERGTIEQLAVTPLTSAQILLPKIIAVELILLFGVSLSLFAIIFPLFEVPMRGSFLLFYAMTALYIFAMSGLGLFIATLSKNLAQVMLISFLVMMPIMLLSGTWNPPESMPVYEQWLMHLSPLYYFTNMGYSIILKGAALQDIWQDTLGLLTLGTALFAFGTLAFKRQFAQNSN